MECETAGAVGREPFGSRVDAGGCLAACLVHPQPRVRDRCVSARLDDTAHDGASACSLRFVPIQLLPSAHAGYGEDQGDDQAIAHGYWTPLRRFWSSTAIG